MKLINCNICNDVVRLIHPKWRTCECGACGGQYNEDLLSATVAGDCSVFGISNLFFDKEFQSLTLEQKVEHVVEQGYPKDLAEKFIWFGEWVGDTQIIRIDAPEGTRVEMDVEWVKEGERTKSTITDTRNYQVGLQDSVNEFEIQNPMIPSFRDQTV